MDKNGIFLRKKIENIKNPQNNSDKNLAYLAANGNTKGNLPLDQMNTNFFKNFASDIYGDKDKTSSNNRKSINVNNNSRLKFDSLLNLEQSGKK